MKHKPVKQNKFYKIEGKEVKRLRRLCDRCGDGTFMAEHKNRWYCGKCGMTIWKKESDKKKEVVKDKTKSENKNETKRKTKAETKKQS